MTDLMTNLATLTRVRASRSAGVLTRRELRRLGWSEAAIDGGVRRGTLRPLLRGVLLLDAEVEPVDWAGLPLSTRLAAAQASHGSRCTFIHETAAQLLGLQGMPPDDGTIQVRLPPGSERHQQPGVVLHSLKLSHADIGTTHGWPITTPERTVTDLMLRLPRFEAISVLDSALHQGLVPATRLPDLHVSARRRRGVSISSAWWNLANGLAESPLETRVRLLATDFGYPPDELQYAVVGPGGVVLGRGDLAWYLADGRVLIAEADGRGPHDLPAALYRDRLRANDFAGLGTIEMVRFTWTDTTRPEYLRSVLRQHLGVPRIKPNR